MLHSDKIASQKTYTQTLTPINTLKMLHFDLIHSYLPFLCFTHNGLLSSFLKGWLLSHACKYGTELTNRILLVPILPSTNITAPCWSNRTLPTFRSSNSCALAALSYKLAINALSLSWSHTLINCNTSSGVNKHFWDSTGNLWFFNVVVKDLTISCLLFRKCLWARDSKTILAILSNTRK